MAMARLALTPALPLVAGSFSDVSTQASGRANAGGIGSAARRPLSISYQTRRLSTRALSAPKVLDLEEESDVLESDKEEEVSPLTPSAYEIQHLLMQVCDETTNIAEVQLKVGSFNLRVRREVGKPAPAPKPVPKAPQVLGKPMVESIPANSVPAAPKPSNLAASVVKPVSNFGLMEAAADAGLLFVTSPKVGRFRKGRVVKGKSSPPLCEEGQIVKKGQVVCYLEQLGTQQPVEADIDGEVVKVLWTDGEPVGYGDPLIAVRPSFPGIKGDIHNPLAGTFVASCSIASI